MKKRILSSLLLSAMLVSMLAACNGGKKGNETETPSSTDTQPEETKITYLDSIGEDVKFNGQTISMMWWQGNEEVAMETTGDVVNDALYDRDLSVQKRLNVKLNHIEEPYSWDTQSVYLGKIRSSVLAKDGAYDIASGQYAVMPGLVPEGNFLDMTKLKYLDFQKPYWVASLIEETTIDGKLYLASGDLSKMSTEQVWCVFYNKTMAESMNLGDLTQLAFDGKWTFDQAKTMSAGVYSDLDGDGKKSGGDRFGFVVATANHVYPFCQAFDLKITTMNEEGYPELSLDNEKTITAVESLFAFLHDDENAVFGGEGGQLMKDISSFADGHALFYVESFISAKAYSEKMQDEWGILPMPKWDESQTEYRTALGESNTLFGILSSTADRECAAAVMEMMAAESKRLVTPALYEKTLKTRYASDASIGQMMDLIKEGVTFGFGSIYGFACNQINIFWKSIFGSSTLNYASSLKQVTRGAVKAIDNFYEKVKELQE